MTYRFSRSAGRSISENDFTLHRRGHEDDQDRKRGESRKHLQCKFFNRCSGRKSYSVMTRLRSFRFDVRRSTEERKEEKKVQHQQQHKPPKSLSVVALANDWVGLRGFVPYCAVQVRSSDRPRSERLAERSERARTTTRQNRAVKMSLSGSTFRRSVGKRNEIKGTVNISSKWNKPRGTEALYG